MVFIISSLCVSAILGGTPWRSERSALFLHPQFLSVSSPNSPSAPQHYKQQLATARRLCDRCGNEQFNKQREDEAAGDTAEGGGKTKKKRRKLQADAEQLFSVLGRLFLQWAAEDESLD